MKQNNENIEVIESFDRQLRSIVVKLTCLTPT